MKKLLVILLLLFPVHGAWAEEIKIEELFGIKFGDNCASYVPKPKHNAPYTLPKKVYNSKNEVGVIPRKENNIFLNYSVFCTKKSKLIYTISAVSAVDKPYYSNDYSVWVDCMKKLKALEKHFITKKNYKFRDYDESERQRESYAIPRIDGSRSIATISSTNSIDLSCSMYAVETKPGVRLYLDVTDFEFYKQAQKEEKELPNIDKRGLD